MIRVATDVGGTFTDLVYYDPDPDTKTVGMLKTAKSHSTPPQFDEGVMDTFAKAGLKPADIEFFAHGCTVVINAFTERNGVKTGLITTRGFRDVLEIARGNRPDLFNFLYEKPKPFVPRYLRCEVSERVNFKGEALRPVALEEVEPILALFHREGVEAIAVCFLHSYANARHEEAVLNEIRRLWPEVSAIASHAITREWREYERLNTTVLAAYVHPVANRYLNRLEEGLTAQGFKGHPFVMQSGGGICTFDSARANPIVMVESGPASGVLGAVALGKLIGESNMITLDIGGTTAKCALIEDGRPRVTTEYKIERTRTWAGYPIKAPVIDIVEIGNGGGSIAWLDEGGKLLVGPRSAGAVPGPAAYGRGGDQPTATDASLLCGRIDPEYFLGGEIVPDMEAVRRAFAPLAEALSLDVEEVARGVIRVADANMVNALKLVSVNRGHDPRDFTLIAFGGGGPMHAAALARELNIPRLIVPIHPAVFSAFGMLLSDMRRDILLTRLVDLKAAAGEKIASVYADLEGMALEEYAVDGVGREAIALERFADMRYAGQEHTVKVPFPAGPVTAESIAEANSRFHGAHEREFTFRLGSPVVIVNFHLVATGAVDRPEPGHLPKTGRRPEDALRGTRRVDFDVDGVHQTPIYERAHMEPDMRLDGPAIVEEPDTTIVVLPDQTLSVDDFGNLHIRPAAQADRRG